MRQMYFNRLTLLAGRGNPLSFLPLEQGIKIYLSDSARRSAELKKKLKQNPSTVKSSLDPLQ